MSGTTPAPTMPGATTHAPTAPDPTAPAAAAPASAAPVRVTAEGRTGIIELNRGEKYNCLSLEVFAHIGAALDQFDKLPELRAILVCATGKHFCTGADLDEFAAVRTNAETLRRFTATGHGVLRRLAQQPLPVIVAVQGLCLAGGLELMLACDICFAASSARFGDQHAQYGLVPGWGGSQRLPHAVGRRRALDLLFSARWIGAEEALSWGLVNQVVSDQDLRAAALGYCQTNGTRSRDGMAVMKKLVDQGLDQTLEAGLALERELTSQALRTDDVSEGLAAFRERRAPDFG